MQSAAVEFKYALGTCLHEGDREAEYETRYDGQPAVVKFIRPETSLEAAKMVADFASAARHREQGAPSIVDFGEAEVFETHVVFAVTCATPVAVQDHEDHTQAEVPLYRKHAKLAIGGVVGASLLCLLLLRHAEHKAPPPVPAPVVVHQQPVQQLSAAPALSATPPTTRAHGHKRARHKRK